MRAALAELATGAADDDARQDEQHAGDTEQVSHVLQAELRVVVHGDVGHEMHADIEGTGSHHQAQAQLARQRNPTELAHPALYR